MPYDNKYNRDILKTLQKINDEYKDYNLNDGEKMEGGFINTLIPLLTGIVAPIIIEKLKKKLTGEGVRELGGALYNKDLGFEDIKTVQQKGRKRVDVKKVKVGTTKENMPGSDIAGMGMKKQNKKGMKKQNKRADIVKKVMKDKNMSMIEASKYVKENNLY